MAERLMGWENEYAFSATGPGGEVVERSAALDELNALARRDLVHLTALNGSGIFLANGGRLYTDAGAHEEACTPECVNPWDVVRYLLAGEQMLSTLLQALVEKKKLRSAWFYRCNVDYSLNGATWGAHESVMHRADPAKLPDDLLPFLASRVIFTGAGGFDATSRTGCRFTLSPRAHFFKYPISDNSTRDRGIFHTKNETLASEGYGRLHVLGESLNSHTGNWLKAATMALCVAMAEAGLSPGRWVGLVSPVDAMRAFSGDPTCRARAPVQAGRDMSALEIQRRYLQCARDNLGCAFMPAWAPRAVEEWGAMLDRLEGAPASVATCLDWAIKYQIFQARIEKRGFTWETLRHWSTATDLLRRCLDVAPGDQSRTKLSCRFLLDPKGPLHGIVEQLTPYLAQRGIDWKQVDDYLRLRLELFEIDMRFGQLGPDGLFNSLDRAGALQHRFPGVDNIEHAMACPPATGRAKLRGEFIRRTGASEGRYSCDWAAIYDNQEDRMLDLRDPWTSDEKWTDEFSTDPDEQLLLEVLRRHATAARPRERVTGGEPF